ncbi:MAG: glycosyltransferase family 1 protein [Flavobacterium sp.]|uniref:glycosyltransferase family 4 protein n=1 Tax=Flavobacterium sp. TaxID=239 RepID=UPI0011FB3A6A|nr:glycosyltransferase family 1 protein [Flavobacterium sp.]RZJ67904.1 MAG: glycosyltransferase family 1 protein [Flavobacterium sp.]
MNDLKRTRIFVDCHVFDGGFQGTRTYIKGLYSVLVQDRSRDFFLAACNVEKLKAEFGEQPNITYIQYPGESKIKRLLFDLPRLLKKHKIDYAHFQYRVPPVKVCKYIVTTHDVLFEDFPEFFPKLNRLQSRITYKYSARMSDIVFTVSSYSKNEISQYLGVTDAIVMPNGVDDIFFETYDKTQIKQEVAQSYGLGDYLIYISRLEPRKNQHLVLQHFIDLELYKTRQLVFVGHETFYIPELHKILDGLSSDIKKRIIFIEHLAYPEMIKLLRGSSAFIYPSIAEGFGIPPLEAAAAGIPVLCSNQTAMSDFTFFGNNLFDPSNEKEFKEKLLRIATSAPNETQLNSLQQTVKENYNWENAARIFNSSIKER